MRISLRLSCCAISFAAILVSCSKIGQEDTPVPTPSDSIKVTLEEGMDWCGVVIDTDGNPIAGVTVSDG